jgi:hypothetical protein
MSLEQLVAAIIRLRKAEELADAEVRAEIAGAREVLEDLAGPTVRPAQAARLLGITPPSLQRRLDRGDIATVFTPTGRREIPRTEVVELLEELERAREAGLARPLTHVIRNRLRSAEDAVDLNRLLPQRRSRSHRIPELQALAYHRLLAERLDERMVERARRRLERWVAEGRIHPEWAREWERVVSKPPPEIAAAISADTKAARELRQTSPFAGMLTEQERRRLMSAVEDRFA